MGTSPTAYPPASSHGQALAPLRNSLDDIQQRLDDAA
jgi:hypothetical protein